ncbi:hypothetical protein Cch01nite_18010 [Cellulomonas chitinilytica]|uniref:non-specific serine/threonine protein kinase n=1 Tax=Cellulomonas chitinilytica TaxID=398759 RepID=A0A919P2T5_9CELL|nr:serine/threonine-protein kinase [Cellulomonas chitinilytica]GIG21077.1 hypothetical protein Cch01nite_18010 [Cellulomonas chitinilytica]
MLDRRGETRPGPSGAPVDAAGADAAGPSPTLDGRYRLGDVLGRGGMATVFRAHDLVLERDVAVKLFPCVDDADDLSRHAAEIRVLAAFDHPNLVTLLDAGSVAAQGGHQTYLVMEVVDGPTLAERLADGPLTLEETLVVAHELADALSAVHAGRVVHRDVKPGNVLLTSATGLRGHDPRTGPVVKLADFGIARLAGTTRLTMTGVTVGTMRYLSPEQAVGGPVGPATDVYALGLVLVECLTGAPAFAGTAAESAAVRLTAGPPVPDEAGTELGALLRRMTALEPGDRPAAQEVAALTAAPPHGHAGLPRTRPVQQVDVPGTRSPRTATTRPLANAAPTATARARRRWLAGAGAVLLAAGAVVVGVRASGSDELPPPPTYPRVDGDLGDALTALQESVAP